MAGTSCPGNLYFDWPWKTSLNALLRHLGLLLFCVVLVACGGNGGSAGPPAVTGVSSNPGSVSTTLSWSIPLEREDGSALVNLAGFQIYFGKQSGQYDRMIILDNPSLSRYVVEGLDQDTYFFVIDAYAVDGATSLHSNEVARIVE